MANHIPCLLYPEGPHGVLRLHVARANPQLAQLAAGQECLVAFHGAQAYITPSWYATKAETHKVVPTWNFVAVHVWGTPVIQDDPAWLRAQLEALTDSQEKARTQPWSVGSGAARFHRRADARHHRCRNPDLAHRRQMEGQPEPDGGRPARGGRRPGERGRQRRHGWTGGAAGRAGLKAAAPRPAAKQAMAAACNKAAIARKPTIDCPVASRTARNTPNRAGAKA